MLSISFHIDISGNYTSPLVKLLWRRDAFVFLKRGIDRFSTEGKCDRYFLLSVFSHQKYDFWNSKLEDRFTNHMMLIYFLTFYGS